MALRRARLVVVAAAVVVVVGALVWGVPKLWSTAKQQFASDSCTVGEYDLAPDQAAVASTMVAASTTYPTELPERAAVLVLAAALQESKLTNIAPGSGDRDSVGVLQQRPSQGWGTVTGGPNSIGDRERRLTDVGEATTEFLDHLVAIPGYRQLPLADAVQEVQVSADGGAYAQHEPEAQALADALLGNVPAGISCSFATPTQVAATATVAAQASDQLGIDTPVVHGRGVRVPGAGWQTAAWFVANADRLGIEKVAYRGRTWTRSDGWAKSGASSAAVTATMYDLAK